MLGKTFLMLFSAFSAVMAAQARDTCTAVPEYFTEGDTVTITYDPHASFLDGNIKGVYYCWQDYHWIAEDMDLVKDGEGVLSATFTIPEDAALVV